MTSLSGKVAIVTGGGRGIGRAVCLKLASKGAKVLVNDLDEQPANDVAAEIKSHGGDALPFPGSVTEADFGDRFVQTALSNFNDIHIIVNNAGYTADALIHKMSDDVFDAMYNVHLKAPFHILRAAGQYIREAAKQEAQHEQEVFRKVVNISSVAGLGGNAGQANYASMKAGVVGLTKTLSKEWGRFKVNVNCVAFGYIETRLTAAVDDKETIEVEGGRTVQIGVPRENIKAIEAMIPLGRGGTPQEAADGVYLFCSPESNYISGQVITVGGGMSF
ncbi:MAG: SDR family oxidoreductase [Clostridia bacterium]|nr:SDR family oxidoreductase [Clostridia bacterium]